MVDGFCFELKRLLPALSVRRERGERPERPERAERSSGRSRTSWYADCTPSPPPHSWYGVSDRGGSAQGAAQGAQGRLGGGGSVSSSGASSSGSPTPQHSLFTLEPLYQFYIEDTVRSACQETGTDSDSDGYERVGDIRGQCVQASEVGAGAASEGGVAGGAGSGSVAGGAGSGGGMMAINGARGPQRTLWCELPEVAGSPLLATLTPHQKKKQEALFEIVTSEASYLNSLEVLCAQFVAHPALRDPRVLPPQDRHLFFDTILPVRRCSQRLMKDLERAWRASITLEGVCEAVGEHARHHFHVYVAYCESQPLLVKALQRLRNNDTFAQVVRELEASPMWQALSLHSFLMLPMQRVTRLPLLLDAVLRHADSDADADPHYQPALQALHTLQKVVSECNEGARNMERAEEMFAICGAVEFPATLPTPRPSLAPESSRAAGRGAPPRRYLVRRGPLTHLAFNKDPKEIKLTFGKRYQKHHLHAFLFNDLLLLTKKKSEESYVAVDWCERSLVEVVEGEEVCGGVGGAGPGAGPAAKHAMLLTLLHNAHGKTVEMLVTCASETERARWREALEGGRRDDSGATVYEGWDCPQVVAVWEWSGRAEGDELPLQAGDVVNVLRKTREGWYWGERLRDARAGWFPGAYTHELLSQHVRARNLRTRYRLLALSHTYLGHNKH